jgi:hypothetical protein
MSLGLRKNILLDNIRKSIKIQCNEAYPVLLFNVLQTIQQTVFGSLGLHKPFRYPAEVFRKIFEE